jgi:lipid A disaccharide synthetase
VLSRKERQEDEARRKFINALRRALLRHKVAFEITLDKNGNVIILLPGKFRRHEIRRINAAAGRAYERLWRHYQQRWIYAILHGAIAQSRLTKKARRRVY